MTTAQDAAPTDAGQEPQNTDAQVEQTLADAGNAEEKRDPWGDPDAARKEIEKLRRENASWRTKYNDAKPVLEQFKQLEEASKTDLQRHEERAVTAEKERDELRTNLARMTAATKHSIPADLVDLLGSGSEEDIEARAELLAKKLQATAPASNGRPVESLRPGAAPGDASSNADPNAWLRRALGSR